MAISLISALKLVPWAEVVSNAPLIVDGARKLWKATGKKQPPSGENGPGSGQGLSPEARTVANLEARVSSLEADVADLQREMASSAGLIKALADQNALLIKAVEFLRRLVLGVAAILGILAIACLYLLAR